MQVFCDSILKASPGAFTFKPALKHCALNVGGSDKSPAVPEKMGLMQEVCQSPFSPFAEFQSIAGT